MSLFTGLEEIVTEDVPMSEHTWFRIGGPAKYFVQPKTEDQLQTVFQRCMENSLSWRVLGHGANLLVDDAGLDCAVIKLDEKAFGELTFDGNIASVGGAASLGKVVLEGVRHGLGGAEALAGIPGSVGGAVKMNVSGRYGDIGTIISRVRVVDSLGNVYWREKGELLFEYRWTNIDDQIVTRVELELLEDDPKRVLDKMREVWIIKKSTQPLSSRSAGCIFKNPSPHQSAGALIDKAGLKGTTMGLARVSEHHANFITAEPGANFSDVIDLIEIVKGRVFEEFGIELEREVEIWQD